MGQPNFGSFLRGARLGWRYSEPHDAMLRMSLLESGRYLIEVCPSDHIPSKHTPAREYVVWWEGEDLRPLVAPLRNVKSPETYQSFVVGDDGEEKP